MITTKTLTLIAGPCTIESEEQLFTIATQAKQSGATILRGGAYKLRANPKSFQGLGADGLRLLAQAGQETGLPIISEILSTNHLDLFANLVDIIQIGARNMYNFPLLIEVAKTNKPVLLKRANSATIEEFLLAAEYLETNGCKEIILCERGIRTFEPSTRNTLDLSAVPTLKQRTNYPIIVDPSHGTGNRTLVPPMAKAAIAAGADGVMLEVHHAPETALCDGPQSITPNTFHALAPTLQKLYNFIQNED